MTPEPESPQQRALREALQTPLAPPARRRASQDDGRRDSTEEPELAAARGIDDLDGLSKRIDALGSVMVRRFASLEAQLEATSAREGGLSEVAARKLLEQVSAAFQVLMDRQTAILDRLDALDPPPSSSRRRPR